MPTIADPDDDDLQAELAFCSTPQFSEFDPGAPVGGGPLPEAFAFGPAIWKRSESMTPNQPGPLRISVGFLDGTDELADEVMREAVKWTGPNGANVEFVRTPASKAMVRIEFATDFNDSLLGSQALQRPDKTKSTMRLGALTKPGTSPGWRKRVVQHEFGHVLGLRHEHQHPESGINWNVEKIVEANLGKPWGKCATPGVSAQKLRELCRESVETFYLSHSASMHKLGGFDMDSVMLYTFPKAFNTNGIAVTKANTISPRDLAFVKMLYP